MDALTLTSICIHTQIHGHTHAYIHTYTHTNTWTHPRLHPYAYTHIHTHTCIHMYVCTNTWTHPHLHPYADTQTHGHPHLIHTHTHTKYMNTPTFTSIRIHTRTHEHAYIILHPHAYKHKHSWTCQVLQVPFTLPPRQGPPLLYLTPSLHQPIKFLGWNMHRCTCKQFIYRSQSIYFQYVFWWKSFHRTMQKIRWKQLQVSNFTLLLVVFKRHHNSEGVKPGFSQSLMSSSPQHLCHDAYKLPGFLKPLKVWRFGENDLPFSRTGKSVHFLLWQNTTCKLLG